MKGRFRPLQRPRNSCKTRQNCGVRVPNSRNRPSTPPSGPNGALPAGRLGLSIALRRPDRDAAHMRRLLPGMVALGAVLMTAPAQASFTSEAGSPSAAGAPPFGLVTADFDRSGRPDVAAINGNGSTVNVYLRQAAGGFAQDVGSPFGGVS